MILEPFTALDFFTTTNRILIYNKKSSVYLIDLREVKMPAGSRSLHKHSIFNPLFPPNTPVPEENSWAAVSVFLYSSFGKWTTLLTTSPFVLLKCTSWWYSQIVWQRVIALNDFLLKTGSTVIRKQWPLHFVRQSNLVLGTFLKIFMSL